MLTTTTISVTNQEMQSLSRFKFKSSSWKQLSYKFVIEANLMTEKLKQLKYFHFFVIMKVFRAFEGGVTLLLISYCHEKKLKNIRVQAL